MSLNIFAYSLASSERCACIHVCLLLLLLLLRGVLTEVVRGEGGNEARRE